MSETPIMGGPSQKSWGCDPPCGPAGGGGYPLLARHMGGRVYPTWKKEVRGGGGYPPPPLLMYRKYLLMEKTVAGRCVTLIIPAD